LGGVGHLVAVGAVAVLVAVVLLPIATLENIVQAHATVPYILEQSLPALAVHVGLSACLWALVVIAYLLWKNPDARPTRVLAHRGTVMVETLVILPLFFLLTFGLAQLAVNNVAGILANVAVYQSARTAWLWQPEIGVDRAGHSMTTPEVQDRSRIAAALVMTPAAPGNFMSNPIGSDAFDKTRFAMAAGQLPMGAGAGDFGSLMAAAGSVDPTVATRNNLSLSTALDESSFLRRTVLKFSHAYEATSVEINETAANVEVTLTYKHHQVMPLVNRFFGDFGNAGARVGYFTTVNRTYSFPLQPYTPNGALPDGSFDGDSGSSDGGGLGDVGEFAF
jgi:hypothetical protein